MFGKHWTAAQGTIVDRRVRVATGDGNIPIYEYVVDVTAPTGEVFRGKADGPLIATDFRDPSIGMTVAVEFDPKSHKVKFDTDDPQLSWKQYKKDRKEGFEASLSAPAGTPAASAPLAGHSAAAGPDLSQIQALLQSQGFVPGEGGFANVVQLDGANVIRMDATSPEAAALRETLLRAFGGTPAPTADPAAQEPGTP